MKLREKDIITLRVEGTGFAAKTDEKVRRALWWDTPPGQREVPRGAPTLRRVGSDSVPRCSSRARRHSSSALSRARWRASSLRGQLAC